MLAKSRPTETWDPMSNKPALRPGSGPPRGHSVCVASVRATNAETGTHGSRAHSWQTAGGARAWVSSSPWWLLKGPEFRRYFLASLSSNTGSWLQSTAQVVLAFQLTGSVAFVGVIVALQFGLVPFCSPVAAVLALRFGGRRVLLLTQLGSAVVAAAMAVCYAEGKLTAHVLAAGALLLGAGYALSLPLQVSLVPALVNPREAEAALRMNSVSYNAGRALAPALSVLIIETYGAGYVFALNALSFGILAWAIAVLRGRSGSLFPDSRPQIISYRARYFEGVRIALRHRRILLLLAIVTAVTLADDPIQVLSPALTSAMHLSHYWTGLLIAALGWGAVAGSVWPKAAAELDDSGAQRASKTAAIWLLVLAGSVVIFVAGVRPVDSLVAAAVAGVAGLFTGVAAQTPIVGRDYKSAASLGALWAISWAGTKPVASLLDGWLASRYGITTAAEVLVTPAVLIAICELSFLPSWRRAIIDRTSVLARV